MLQPALSMSLTKLEDEIGKLFFVREGRQMTLTEIRLYRIGGVGAPLLLSGCYDLPDYRLKLKLVHNYDAPDVVGQQRLQ